MATQVEMYHNMEVSWHVWVHIQTCSNCQKLNHFETVCHSPSKTAMQIHADDDSEEYHAPNASAQATFYEEEYLFHVNGQHKTFKSTVEVCFDSNIPVEFIPDTGASVTIIDYETFLRLKQVKHYPLIRADHTKIYSYGAVTPLELRGSFYTKVSYKGNQSIIRVYVLQKFRCGNLLCKDDCVKLKLLRFTDDSANSISVNQCKESSTILNNNNNS